MKKNIMPTKKVQLRSHQKRLSGFSLLEIVATIGIITFGLFVLSMAQIKTLKRAQNSLTEARITNDIDNMFELIKSNFDAHSEYNTTCTLVGDTMTCTPMGTSASVIADINAWKTNLTDHGVTEATIASTGNSFTITVTYPNNGAYGANPAAMEISSTAVINPAHLQPVAP